MVLIQLAPKSHKGDFCVYYAMVELKSPLGDLGVKEGWLFFNGYLIPILQKTTTGSDHLSGAFKA